MIIRLAQTKGFILIDLLISLSIISIFTFFTVSLIYTTDFEHLTFFHTYLYLQSNSIANKSENILENQALFSNQVKFNEKGNVNLAQKILINKQCYVINLATGKLIKK